MRSGSLPLLVAAGGGHAPGWSPTAVLAVAGSGGGGAAQVRRWWYRNAPTGLHGYGRRRQLRTGSTVPHESARMVAVAVARVVPGGCELPDGVPRRRRRCWSDRLRRHRHRPRHLCGRWRWRFRCPARRRNRWRLGGNGGGGNGAKNGQGVGLVAVFPTRAAVVVAAVGTGNAAVVRRVRALSSSDTRWPHNG